MKRKLKRKRMTRRKMTNQKRMRIVVSRSYPLTMVRHQVHHYLVPAMVLIYTLIVLDFYLTM